MTHDYKRHGTTTLFAALNVLDGKVIGRCMQRHRHQEFIRFLNAIEAAVPVGKIIHVILDNYGAHKHTKVRPGSTAIRAWSSITRRPRLVAQRRRGLLRQAHQAAPEARRLPIARRPAGRHQPLPRRDQHDPKPFVWTADPDRIIAAVKRGHQMLDSIH